MTFSNLIEHAAVENTYKKTEKKELEQHFNFLAQDFLSPFLRLSFFSPSFDSLSALIKENWTFFLSTCTLLLLLLL